MVLLNQTATEGKNQDKSKRKLQTEAPLSEKDEVKQAEHRVAKAQKEVKETVKADLKNRAS